MKSREWFLVIIILILGQLLLHYWTSSAMSAVEVINYISFAGTIVSIILAVLAIIYAFYQSYSQQETASSIANEVKKLNEASNILNKSTIEMSEQVSSVVDKLAEIPSVVETYASKIEVKHDDIISRLSNFKSISESEHDDEFGSNRLDYISLMIVSLAVISSDTLLNIYQKTINEVVPDQRKQYAEMMSHASAILTALSFLGWFNVVNSSEGRLYTINKNIGIYEITVIKKAFHSAFGMWNSDAKGIFKEDEYSIFSCLDNMFNSNEENYRAFI
ncbi:hypothetical protein [Aeromonas hydrophila]|uniref:hypothetical protein n=1 Tax=Aeromonas hydrophila TaxID=644 RepID=UPI0012D3EE1C|nr:hypothetical protein [Aeromonas hydrophila]